MFLASDSSMKVVYELRRELAEDPDHVVQVQALTLNKDKPLLGLMGTCGLFGSERWWKSVEKGKIRKKVVSGVISELVFAGQDSRWGNQVNSFKLAGSQSTSQLMSIEVQEKEDRELFCVGARVEAIFVLDELKDSPRFPFGTKNFSEILLEMAVSRWPEKAQQSHAGDAAEPRA